MLLWGLLYEDFRGKLMNSTSVFMLLSRKENMLFPLHFDSWVQNPQLLCAQLPQEIAEFSPLAMSPQTGQLFTFLGTSWTGMDPSSPPKLMLWENNIYLNSESNHPGSFLYLHNRILWKTPCLWCYQSQLSCHKNCKTSFFYKLQASWIRGVFSLIFTKTEKNPQVSNTWANNKTRSNSKKYKTNHFPPRHSFACCRLTLRAASRASTEHSQAEETQQGSAPTGEIRGKNCDGCTADSVPLWHRFPLPRTIFPAPVAEHPITPATGTKPQLWEESNNHLCDPRTITNSSAPREWKTGPKFISGLTAAKAVPFGSCYFCEMEDGKCEMETATISLMEITSETMRKGVTNTHSCFRRNV